MKRNPIESPCIRYCTFVDDICQGCLRTEDEAFEWYEFTDEQRQEVWNRIIQQTKEQ